MDSKNNLLEFIDKNSDKLTFVTISQIAELSNAERNNEEAFYTNKFLLNYINGNNYLNKHAKSGKIYWHYIFLC